MRRMPALVVGCLSLAVLASCASGSKASTSSATSAPRQTSGASVTAAPGRPVSSAAIMIETGGSGFMFTATPVKAGATVTVKNTTGVQHTVSADSTAGGFDVTVDA